jgi:uncharacterized protein YhaN
LSGGAREQIGLIARMACAMIVSHDGGVPLIIDDALGHTDAVRLESMAAVISVAAKDCQIIVLTCYPERYRHGERASAPCPVSANLLPVEGRARILPFRFAPEPSPSA